MRIFAYINFGPFYGVPATGALDSLRVRFTERRRPPRPCSRHRHSVCIYESKWNFSQRKKKVKLMTNRLLLVYEFWRISVWFGLINVIETRHWAGPILTRDQPTNRLFRSFWFILIFNFKIIFDFFFLFFSIREIMELGAQAQPITNKGPKC